MGGDRGRFIKNLSLSDKIGFQRQISLQRQKKSIS